MVAVAFGYSQLYFKCPLAHTYPTLALRRWMMKRFLTVVLLGSLLLSATLSITGCTSKSSLVGKWERLPFPTPTPGGSDWGLGELFSGLAEAFLPNQIEFFEDGKYASDNPMSFLPGGEWKVVENNRLRLSTAQGIIVYTFSINGDIMTLTDDSGGSLQFRRAK